MGLARAAVSRACRRAGEPCLSVLIYHRVLEEPDFMRAGDVTETVFRRQMQLLGRLFNVLELGEAAQRLSEGTLPKRPLCITFDDGYADNCEVACPILRAMGLHATFFIATAYLDGGRMWNDTVIEAIRRERAPGIDLTPLGLGLGWVDLSTPEQRKDAADRVIRELKYLPGEQRVGKAAWFSERVENGLPDTLMMTSDQVCSLDALGMGVGAHTETHPILALLERDEALREIRGGKERLEQMLGKQIDLFAYPNGKVGRDFTARDVELVNSLGFKAAVTTERGTSSRSTPRLEIHRFSPSSRFPLEFVARVALNCRHQS